MFKALLIALTMSVFASAGPCPKEWQGALVPQAAVGSLNDVRTLVYKYVDYQTGQQFYIIVSTTFGQWSNVAGLSIHTLPCQ